MAYPKPVFNQQIFTDKVRDDDLGFLSIKLQVNRKGVSDAVRDAAIKAANGAADTMRLYVPKQSTEGLSATGRLRDSINVVRDKSPSLGVAVGRTPGGAGGGFTYETKVEVGRGVPYARYVVEGTGLYGPKQKRIYPETKKAMSFKAGYVGDLSDIRASGGNIGRRAAVNIFEPREANRATLTKKNQKYKNNAIAYSTRGQRPNTKFITEGQKRARKEVRIRLKNIKAFR